MYEKRVVLVVNKARPLVLWPERPLPLRLCDGQGPGLASGQGIASGSTVEKAPEGGKEKEKEVVPGQELSPGKKPGSAPGPGLAPGHEPAMRLTKAQLTARLVVVATDDTPSVAMSSSSSSGGRRGGKGDSSSSRKSGKGGVGITVGNAAAGGGGGVGGGVNDDDLPVGSPISWSYEGVQYIPARGLTDDMIQYFLINSNNNDDEGDKVHEGDEKSGKGGLNNPLGTSSSSSFSPTKGGRRERLTTLASLLAKSRLRHTLANRDLNPDQDQQQDRQQGQQQDQEKGQEQDQEKSQEQDKEKSVKAAVDASDSNGENNSIKKDDNPTTNNNSSKNINSSKNNNNKSPQDTPFSWRQWAKKHAGTTLALFGESREQQWLAERAARLWFPRTGKYPIRAFFTPDDVAEGGMSRIRRWVGRDRNRG